MEHIWTILIIKKNTHTCERNRIEIDQRKIFKISLLIYNSFYLAKKNHRYVSRFLTNILMGNVDIFSLFGNHSEYIAQFVNVIIGKLSFHLQCKVVVDFLFLTAY